MPENEKALEEKAHQLLEEQDYHHAYELFKKAANIYKEKSNHSQAALCFALAASCWAIKCGEKTFYNAAEAYELAAKEAYKACDYEYASLLYKYAAINYERDGEYLNFSEAIYSSKDTYRKFLLFFLMKPKKLSYITDKQQVLNFKTLMRNIFHFIALSFSFLIWGYGEKPSRTIFFGIFVILATTISYMFGNFVYNNSVISLNFFDALYFSTITFTTVGYGDIVPVGFSKIIAICEAFIGVLTIPIFIVGFSRKYLRF
ncbi:MAG: ion channel [Candidatus Omnitrophica bacterium]|nr:ion channel [Candidatus Omnitrophota bacterium]